MAKFEEIEMVELKSSNIAAVGYSEVTSTLRVMFCGSKRTYDYSDVPKSHYYNMISETMSAGHYFYVNIRDKYVSVEIT